MSGAKADGKILSSIDGATLGFLICGKNQLLSRLAMLGKLAANQMINSLTVLTVLTVNLSFQTAIALSALSFCLKPPHEFSNALRQIQQYGLLIPRQTYAKRLRACNKTHVSRPERCSEARRKSRKVKYGSSIPRSK